MFVRPTRLLLSLLCLSACGSEEDSGSSNVAGAWLLCLDDPCDETDSVGWYFPTDHGPLQRLKVSDGKICAEEAGGFEESSWEEAEDEAVLLHDLPGTGSLRLDRHGDLLDAIVALDDPQARYMVKVADTPDRC